MSLAPRMLPQTPRSDRLMFSSSDDNAMLKQIQSTHSPDGREVEVRPILHLIEDIFQRAKPTIPRAVQTVPPHLDTFDDRAVRDTLEFLSYTINKISCEMSCKCMGGGDAHATTLNIFSILSTYSWDAKVVLALAAFAATYGEFWLVAHLYPTNSLAKAVAVLKQLPEIMERADALKPKFDAITNLINAMVALTKCIIEFRELPAQYIGADTPELLTAIALIPTASYWIVRSVVACASQIIALIGMGPEFVASTMEAWELSSLAHKISSIHSHLTKQLTLCHQLISDKKHIEAFQKLVRLFEATHIDNFKILQALIYAKDDQLPLFDGTTKKRVSLDILRRKNVLLLISEIDIPPDELAILEQMYLESRQHSTRLESQYEIVWIPVVDRSSPWTEESQKQFEAQQSAMPWHSVYHPSLIDPAVIKYIKEVWKFNKKMMIVVLDPNGKVANHNAVHMMWIWGSLAYPFTSAREEALWKEETWRLELLADSIDPTLIDWISQDKYICLYGGEDLEWIKIFTATARAVAQAAGIPLEMLYVGKSNPRDKVRRNNEAIAQGNLSHTLPDLLIWFFWVRLESMWHSKVQLGKSVENDLIMQEIMAMLSFDGSDQGWAVFSRGSAELARAKGDAILPTLRDYDQWKQKKEEMGFVPALKDRLQEVQSPHHCTRLILRDGREDPREGGVRECGRAMEKFIMYRCCQD